MSVTILVTACVRSGGLRNLAKIDSALRDMQRGEVRTLFVEAGKYDWRPNDLNIHMVREVGLGGQIDGVPCERLVAEDTLAALREVCPVEGIDVQAYLLDFVRDQHAIESYPLSYEVQS